MRDVQARIIAELNVTPVFDPAEQVRTLIDFLKAFVRAT
jgi:NAD+ synthase